jgi:antitoxin HicB
MISYPAVFELDEDGKTFNVHFPDLEGCFTYGETLEDALRNAQEALSVHLESLDSRRITIPSPSSLEGTNVRYITPDIKIAFAIEVKRIREMRGLTQKDIASKMGIGWASYQRLENPRRTNPTLDTIHRLEEVLDVSFFK